MPKEIFRLTTAGSVDDGKSTLLARLLLDSGNLYEDQLPQGGRGLNLADLLDGLESERQQGITIDVAHRFFDTAQRRYHFADSPGHEQYTRNMATACAGSDAVLLVLTATDGVKPQTLIHLEVALRLGIKRFIFVINKMDLVRFSKTAYERTKQQVLNQLETLGNRVEGLDSQFIPVSGLGGQNVVHSSSRLSWFNGPTLLAALEQTPLLERQDGLSVFSVQMTQRLENGGRRYLGSVVSGDISTGQALYLPGSKWELAVSKVFHHGEIVDRLLSGQTGSIEIDSDVDISRGAVLASESLQVHDQFDADLIWLASEPGAKGRTYLLQNQSRSTNATLTRASLVDMVAGLKTGEVSSLNQNQIARVNLSISEALPLQPFIRNVTLGRFTLIDKATGQTAAVGAVNYPLRRSENVTKEIFEVTSELHAELTGNNPKVLWFTGLPSSGKSTLANGLSKRLFALRRPHFVLDGDNLRLGINRDLGFTDSDRAENIRRTAEIANLMADAGLIVLVSLVSPIESDREFARHLIGEQRFRLIYVATPIEVCEQRDPKGLFKKARAGRIPNLTGYNAPYDVPRLFDYQTSLGDSLDSQLDALLALALDN